jgi:hypothetical protein
MRIRLEDHSRCKELVRHFRARGYLAVEREPGILEVLPIDAPDEERARTRTLADLEEWTRANDGVAATPLPDVRE